MTYLPGGGADQFYGADFVFNPEHLTPGGNVYTSWALLVDAVKLREGVVTVLIGDTIKGAPVVIPTGFWDLAGAIGDRVVLVGPPGVGIEVEIADGCVISGVIGISDLLIDSQSDAYVISLVNKTFFLAGKTDIEVSGAGPFFHCVSGGGSATDFSMGGESRILSGAGNVFNVGATTTFQLTMFDKAYVESDTFDGAVGSGFAATIVSPACVLNSVQTDWNGGVLPPPTISALASVVAYSGPTNVTTVQDMLDWARTGYSPSTSLKILPEYNLADNQVAPTTTGFTFSKTDIAARLFYTIQRDTTFDAGEMMIVCDNAAAAFSIIGTPANLGGATGITFSVDVSGASVRLLYTSTNTGNVGKLTVRSDTIPRA